MTCRLSAQATSSLRLGARRARGAACSMDCVSSRGRPSRRPGLSTRSRCVRRYKGGCHGYEVGKQVAGRRCPIAMDTQGLPLTVLVQAASVQDPVGAAPCWSRPGPTSRSCTCAGPTPATNNCSVASVAATLGLCVEVGVARDTVIKGLLFGQNFCIFRSL